MGPFDIGKKADTDRVLLSQPILGNREIETYIASILSADDKNYENPTSYVARNAYFFTRDLPIPPPAPVTADPSDNSVPTLAEVEVALQDMLITDELKLLRFLALNTADQSYAAMKQRLDSDVAAYAKAIEGLCESRADEVKMSNGDEADKGKVVKEWRKAVHRLLRERLAFGMPGPGSAVLMGVLGYEETCRRLSVDVVGE